MKNTGLPWTLVQYKPMDRRGVLMGFGPSLYPLFGPRCNDTVTTRSLGRTHYPRREPKLLLSQCPSLLTVSIPFLLELPIRHHTPHSDRNNMLRCLSEHTAAATVLRPRTRRCDKCRYIVHLVEIGQNNTVTIEGTCQVHASTPFFPFLVFKPSFSSDRQGISASSPDEVRA